MKMMTKMLSIVALLILATSCVSTSVVLPEKYNLDTDLKAVARISAFKVSSWNQVDNQSVIITANGNEYYLLVLDRPLESDISDSAAGFLKPGSNILSGVDKIFLRNSSGREYYIVSKIYKLDGRMQAKDIKARLSKS